MEEKGKREEKGQWEREEKGQWEREEEARREMDEEAMRLVEEKKRRKRHRKPLAFIKFIVKRPGLAFGLALSGQIFIASINFILWAAGYDIMPIDFQVFPVQLTRTHETAQREAAWAGRDGDPEAIRRFTVTGGPPTWLRGHMIDDMTLYYTRWLPHGNVLERDIFLQMKATEDELFQLPEYRDYFCQLDADRKCLKPRSLLRYFDGSMAHVSDVFDDPDFRNIPRVLGEANTLRETADDFLYFLGHGYVLTADTAFSNITRSSLPLGWPLSENVTSAEDFQRVIRFLEDTMIPTMEHAQPELTDGLEFVHFSYIAFGEAAPRQAVKDMLLALGSLCFIFCFIWLQTRSLWVTWWAVFSIITGFMITNLIYRTILNIQYFGYLNLISVFIILGIGADDIFVFVNTWKATELEDYPSLAHRFSDAYRTASLAMFFTSFTTMMAFLIGGISPVLPIATFGIFTGLAIAVNYVSVIVYFPTVVMMHHVYFRSRCCPCCCGAGGCCPSCKKRGANDDEEAVVASPEVEEEYVAMQSMASPKAHRRFAIAQPQSAPEGAGEERKKRKKAGLVVRFFRGPYFRFITHPVVRWVIIGVFTVVLAFFTWSATRLEVDADSIRIYRSSHNYGKAMILETTAFVPGPDDWVQVILSWGMHPRDMSMCHRSDYLCRGLQVWDETFDLNTPPAQLALHDFCHLLKSGLSKTELERLMIKRDSFTGELEVDCFMDNLNQYMLGEEDRLLSRVPVDFPLMQTDMTAFMDAHPLIYNASNLPAEFYRYFEIGVSNWLNNGYTFLMTSDFHTFNSLVGEVRDPPNSQVPRFMNVLNQTALPAYYGTRLRYAGIRVNMSLSTQRLSFHQGFPVRDAWEEFFNQQLEEMPLSIRNGYQLTETTWHWMELQLEFVRNAKLGIIIGIAIACPVLIIATMNVITGLLATATIACVTISSLGILPVIGWRVDVMISMNLCLLVGLSVDYAVHMAEAYYHSPYPTRLYKVRYMLEHVGVSVLCGAFTTIGASVFMFPAQLQFFFQFATFLFCTLGFSLVYTLTIFVSVLSLIGPEREVGHIGVPFRNLRREIFGRSKRDVDCEECHGKGFHAPIPQPGDRHAVQVGKLREVEAPHTNYSVYSTDVSEDARLAHALYASHSGDNLALDASLEDAGVAHGVFSNGVLAFTEEGHRDAAAVAPPVTESCHL